MAVRRLRLPSHVLRAAGGLSFLWLGSLVGAGCAFLTQVLLARSLGPANFGAFTATLNMIILVSPLASFGLGGFWLRVFGEEGWTGTRWLRASLQYTIVSTILVFAGLAIWSTWGPHDAATRWLLAILSGYLLGQVAVELVSAKLQLEARYLALTIWQVFPHLARLALISVIAYAAAQWMTLETAALIYLAVALTALIVGGVDLGRMYRGGLRLAGHDGSRSIAETVPEPSPKDVASQSWPFGFAGIFHLIYFQSNIILLKYLAGDEAAGIYNVAFVIMSAVYLLPGVLYQKFLIPKIHIWSNHDKAKFRKYYYYGAALMAISGLAAMTFIFFLSPFIVLLLFGQEYAQAAVILQILSLAIPFRFVASSVGSTMMSKDVIKTKTIIMCATAGLNVLLNLSLIPHFGMTGSAVATVTTEITLLAMYYAYSKRYVNFGT